MQNFIFLIYIFIYTFFLMFQLLKNPLIHSRWYSAWQQTMGSNFLKGVDSNLKYHWVFFPICSTRLRTFIKSLNSFNIFIKIHCHCFSSEKNTFQLLLSRLYWATVYIIFKWLAEFHSHKFTARTRTQALWMVVHSRWWK